MESEIKDLRRKLIDKKYNDILLEYESNRSDIEHDDHKKLLYLSAMFLAGRLSEEKTLSEFLDALSQRTSLSASFASDIAMGQMLLGRHQEAYALLKSLMDAGYREGAACGRYASLLAAGGDWEGAERWYKEAIALEPGRAVWHNALGTVYVTLERLEEALQSYEEALRIDPQYEQALENIVLVRKTMGEQQSAEKELEQRLLASPDDHQTRVRYANLLCETGRAGEAIDLLKEKLVSIEKLTDASSELREVQTIYRKALARIFRLYDRHLYVAQLYGEIRRLAPAEEEVYLLGEEASALIEAGELARAKSLIEQIATRSAEHESLLYLRSKIAIEEERYDEAEHLLKTLTERYRGNAEFFVQLGQVYMWLGKKEEAIEEYRKAMRIDPLAVTHLIRARELPEDPQILSLLHRAADRTINPTPLRSEASFALATIYEKKKEYRRSFDYLKQANRLIDESLFYDPDDFSRTVEEIIAAFDRDFFDNLPPIRQAALTPVFIVGMPRSGTTLTEQILGTHPLIHPAGELEYLPKLERSILDKLGREYSGAIRALTPELREEAARYYLQHLLAHNERTPFIVDKLPHNFLRLGLIRTVLPNAKIIHIQRDPRDTALSNYQQNFKAKHGGMGYSFDLVKIARQINDYHRLMEHWRAIGIPMFELTYEELVADQEGMTRELLKYVGVEWDEGVRDFHKTERAVKTASVAQVRQPIYQSSKQKWRRYEEELAPLIAHLDPELLERWDGRA